MENKYKKLLTDCKGQINQRIIAVAVIIISIIVIFNIASSLVPEAQSAGDRFSDATKCAEASCFSNVTLSPSCVINSSIEGSAIACPNDIQNIPVASIFGSQGVIILLMMIFIFIIVFRIVIPGRKK